MAVVNAAVSAGNSRGLVYLSEKFTKFDRAAASRSRRPSNDRPRTFYLLVALFIGGYNLAYNAFAHRDVVFYVLLMWSALCTSIMLPVVQYAAFVRILRQRYALVNGIFTNSEYPTAYRRREKRDSKNRFKRYETMYRYLKIIRRT